MMTSSKGNIFRVTGHFPRHWPFVRGIHRSPVNSPHKGQWRGALMFCFICAWIDGWVNNREAGDLRRHRAHYDVIVMFGTVRWHTGCFIWNMVTSWLKTFSTLLALYSGTSSIRSVMQTFDYVYCFSIKNISNKPWNVLWFSTPHSLSCDAHGYIAKINIRSAYVAVKLNVIRPLWHKSTTFSQDINFSI